MILVLLQKFLFACFRLPISSASCRQVTGILYWTQALCKHYFVTKEKTPNMHTKYSFWLEKLTKPKTTATIKLCPRQHLYVPKHLIKLSKLMYNHFILLYTPSKHWKHSACAELWIPTRARTQTGRWQRTLCFIAVRKRFSLASQELRRSVEEVISPSAGLTLIQVFQDIYYFSFQSWLLLIRIMACCQDLYCESDT